MRARFLSHVNQLPLSCWLWLGYTDKQGYGHFRVGGKIKLSHRVAYEMWVADIEDGLEIDHLCGVEGCVNPLHLEAVSRVMNMRRARRGNHAPNTCKRGHDASESYARRDGYLGGCRQCAMMP